MTSAIAPIYRDRKSRLEIDSCVPQSAAMRGGKIELHALSRGYYPGVLLKNGQLPGIASIGFWNGTGKQDWGLEAHRNEGVEICFLETGSMVFSVETKNFELRPGDFTITRPWQLHKLGSPNIGPGKLHWLILDVGVRRPNQEWRLPSWLALTRMDKAELTRKLRQTESPVWRSSPEIAEAFRQISQGVIRWGNPQAESHILIGLNQLFLEILVALTQQQKDHNPELASRRRTVELFLKDLASNPNSVRQAWTLPKMSAHCGLGVTAFSKYCRELVNISGVEYLNQCRLEHASSILLKNPERSITEIAFDVGFNSSQYFATHFRRKFKIPPTIFKTKMLSTSGEIKAAGT